MKLPPIILKELEKIGLPWAVETGRRHFHLKINGRTAAVFPKGHRPDFGHGVMNFRGEIRRFVRAMGH